MLEKRFDLKFAHEMSKKYAGRFVAVVNEKVIAIGKNRLEVFHKAEEVVPPTEKIGVFYFLTKKDMLTAL